jgi:hypothetical protein
MFSEPASPGTGLYEDRVNIGDRTDGMKMTVSSFGSFHPQWLHYKLSQNAEYRMRFADRANMHLTGNGALTPQKALERLNNRVAEIETAVIAESARWGAAKSWVSWPYTKNDNWLPEIRKIKDDWIPYRTDIVILQLKEAGLYSSLKPPVVKKSGTVIESDKYFINGVVLIDIINEILSGKVYYTLDGNDPRLVGGAVSPTAFYASRETQLTISSSVMLRARSYTNGIWSALISIDFLASDEDFTGLKITELHYHPPDEISNTDTIEGKDLEFIEFKNTEETSLNLSGLVLDSAVNYTFPENKLLGPKQFYVIASKPSKFYDQYGLIASGNYSGNLSNAGEEILLKHDQNGVLLRFSYSDAFPWPRLSDGSGYSLVATIYDPTGFPGEPVYWRASSEMGGSPFRNDPWPVQVNDQISNDGDIAVYPNPASEYIFIHISKLEDQQLLDIQLLNMDGKLIHRTTISNNSSVDLNNLGMTPGLYLLRVRSDKFSGTAMFAFFLQ